MLDVNNFLTICEAIYSQFNTQYSRPSVCVLIILLELVLGTTTNCNVAVKMCSVVFFYLRRVKSFAHKLGWFSILFYSILL